MSMLAIHGTPFECGRVVQGPATVNAGPGFPRAKSQKAKGKRQKPKAKRQKPPAGETPRFAVTCVALPFAFAFCLLPFVFCLLPFAFQNWGGH
jgi:hypothetical protein